MQDAIQMFCFGVEIWALNWSFQTWPDCIHHDRFVDIPADLFVVIIKQGAAFKHAQYRYQSAWKEWASL